MTTPEVLKYYWGFSKVFKSDVFLKKIHKYLLDIISFPLETKINYPWIYVLIMRFLDSPELSYLKLNIYRNQMSNRWILDKISFPRDDDTQSSVISVRGMYLPTTDLSILGNWIWMLTYTSNTLIWSVTTRSSPGKWEKNSLVSPPEYVAQEIEVCHNRLPVVTHFQCFSSSPILTHTALQVTM